MQRCSISLIIREMQIKPTMRHHLTSVRISSVTQSCLTLCDPMDCSMPECCSSPTPRACSNPCPLSQWYHPTISSSVIPLSSCLQSFLASGFFLVINLFASGGQSIGASALASVLPMNIQDWYPLGFPVRIDIKKSTNNKCWRSCGEEGTLLHCWWECKLIQPLWRTVWNKKN